jgi:hypothetical protein
MARAVVPGARHWPLAALVMASVLWGGAVAGTKYALRAFDPVTLLSVELASSVIFLHEDPARTSVIGACLIGGSVVCFTLCDRDEGHPSPPAADSPATQPSLGQVSIKLWNEPGSL